MMCSAEVTGSFVPTEAKQMQSVEPETDRRNNELKEHKHHLLTVY